ncbi:hypothetical protein PR202_ga22758 [Eleusine coracana subsp. coracana]|uniref:Peptidase A1 domain-containing protein n=1 Tax=Eleusine coracana subsp. coracana TaxID=191504 RepID=A0AAV5D424_ELECO|nr:hypothetical protein PR202_ga22758 [Eleusine coracana subsp. coracana]
MARNTTLVLAFLVLVLVMPQMVASKFPRIAVKKSIPKKVIEILKEISHEHDLPDLIIKFLNVSDKRQPPPRNGGGVRSQLAGITDVGSYQLSIGVGTPSQIVSGVLLDINNELVWTQCGCPLCKSTTSGGGTLFYPNKSSTVELESCKSSACQSFSPQTCSSSAPQCFFRDTYISNTPGALVTDKFWFGGGDSVNVTLGCVLLVTAELGRGPFSLVSQLGNGRFSYYFAPNNDDGEESFVYFADDAKPNKSSRAMSTPLLESNANPSSYYVGLTGIQVDGKDLPIPSGTFDLNQTDGSGGVILSITVPLTFLPERAYKLLEEELKSKIGLPTANGSALGFDLCYTNKSLATVEIPAMALVFDGNNAVMKLDKSNYFYMMDVDTGLECLTILQWPYKASLLGGLIQEGTHMIYDVRGNKLQFESFQQQASPTRSDSSNNKGLLPEIFVSLLVANFLWVVLLYDVLY